MYKICKKIIFIIVFVQFVTSGLLFTPLQNFLLLPANLLEHFLGVIFFGALACALYGLLVKKEYVGMKFGQTDAFLLILVFLFAYDYWFMLSTPHPLFHDVYYI